MLHHQLAAACEQIGQRLLALRAVEHIGLVDLDPGQCAPLFAQPFAGAGVFLFMRQMRFAGFDPFFTRDDFVRLHDRLLCIANFQARCFSRLSSMPVQPRSWPSRAA
jgi:hypothetical protein